MRMRPLPSFGTACVLKGVLALLTPPQRCVSLRSVVLSSSVISEKRAALSRSEEEKVPSIAQVVFDDSQFALGQGYRVSAQHIRNVSWRAETVSWPLPSRLSPIKDKWDRCPPNSHKQWDTCVQWTTRTQTNEEATWAPRTDASREDSMPSKHTPHRTTASWQEGLWGTERDGALGFSKFNTHTPEPAHNGWHMNIFFIYINSVYSHSCVSGKKITSASNPGLHRYILYLETKFNLKRWTEVVVGKRKGTDKRNELQTPRSTI